MRINYRSFWVDLAGVTTFVGLPGVNRQILVLSESKKSTFLLQFNSMIDRCSGNQHSEEFEMKPLLSITIEISGMRHSLHVYPQDSPKHIAFRFCIENHWDLSCVDVIAGRVTEAF